MSENDCKISELTARDHFAMHILPALVPKFREMFMDNTYEDWHGDAMEAMVWEAYAIADAMLKIRAGKMTHPLLRRDTDE